MTTKNIINIQIDLDRMREIYIENANELLTGDKSDNKDIQSAINVGADQFIKTTINDPDVFAESVEEVMGQFMAKNVLVIISSLYELGLLKGSGEK